MRNAYSRSEEFLDLEKGDVQSLEKKLEKEKTENLTAEELVLLQNLLKKLDNPKLVQGTTTSA